MLPYLIAGAIGFGIGKLFENGGETFMAGGMTNEDILRSFLTSERETQTNNLATFYSTMGGVMLLRNYGTLIAKRMGRNVEITNVKHSKTTSSITNRLKALAEEMGYNVSYVSEFENGGETFMAGGTTNEDTPQIILDYLVQDFNHDEYVAFCYEYGIDDDDAMEMSNFIYSLSDNEANEIIEKIEGNYFFRNGGVAKKRRRSASVQYGRSDTAVDKTRVAKPVGYRFTNAKASELRKDPYDKPTEAEVKKYLGKGIYKENRKRHSDRDRNVKL